jgi:hypothetical protein
MKTKYGTYKSVIELKKKDGAPSLELTTWKGDLIDFLVSSGALPHMPQAGETVKISIEENVDIDSGWFMT